MYGKKIKEKRQALGLSQEDQVGNGQGPAHHDQLKAIGPGL